MRIEKLMSHQVTTCRPQDSLEHAASLMWSSDRGCLPVTSGDDGRWIEGIITDRDICMAALFQGRSLHDLRVEDAMVKKVLTCRATDELDDAQRQMRNARIRRMPVVDKDGGLIGVVSMVDVVREAARQQYGQHHEIPAGEVMTTLAKISTSAPVHPAT